MNAASVPEPQLQTSAIMRRKGRKENKPPKSVIDQEDPRRLCPKNLEEVEILHHALQPSIQSFTRITGTTPSITNGTMWQSYAVQLDLLQTASDKTWIADRGPGVPPKLAGLNAWYGGIKDLSKATFAVSEECRRPKTNGAIVEFEPSHGSLLWYEQEDVPELYKKAEKDLRDAAARKDTAMTEAEDSIGDSGGCGKRAVEDQTVTADGVIARNPGLYLSWLSTAGYATFSCPKHNPMPLSWENWCLWLAPSIYSESCPTKDHHSRPVSGPGSTDGRKFTPGVRPSITLEEARKGNERWAESRKYMGSIRLSEDGAALGYAVRAQDLWLSKAIEMIKKRKKYSRVPNLARNEGNSFG